MTRSKSVIGQSSRREDIKRSYSLASKEGRHKELSASLRGEKTSREVIGQSSRREDSKRSYSLVFEERRHQEKLSANLQGEKTSSHLFARLQGEKTSRVSRQP
jgi:hypothetical protein